MSGSVDLDSPERANEIRQTIREKPGLKALYEEFYSRFSKSLGARIPDGPVVEIGSGAGFLKEYLPNIVTSDILPYEGVDRVVDATRMPFGNESLGGILMLNVLHHIPNVESFFGEAVRTLMPGGKLVVIDQHPGWIGKPILKYLHHEPFNLSRDWAFPSSGPLSGANGALAWIIFFRDRAKFESMYPRLRIRRRETHTPLRYWMSGGLKRWTLLPKPLFGFFTWLDRFLIRISPEFGSFVHVEIEKE